jgi:hypothetical protein
MKIKHKQLRSLVPNSDRKICYVYDPIMEN